MGNSASPVLRRLIELVDAYKVAHDAKDEAMAKRAGMLREAWARACRKGRDGSGGVELATAEKMAAAIGHRLMLIPDDLAPDVEALLARRPEPLSLDAPIAELCLTQRSLRALGRAGIEVVSDLIGSHRDDLLDLPGFGPGCLKEVETMLAHHGLALKGGAT